VTARLAAPSFELAEMAAAGSKADAPLGLGRIHCAGRARMLPSTSSVPTSGSTWRRAAALPKQEYRMEIAREMSKREIAGAPRQARSG